MEKDSYTPNGRLQSVRQIAKPDTLKSLGNRLLMLHHVTPPPARLAFLVLLLVLVLSLVACATTSAPPTNTPKNPAMPPSVLPESPVDYLGNARAFLSKTQKQLQELTATPAN